MDDFDIETLPRMVAEGTLSKREATNMIWKDIYVHPNKYGLEMRSDEKSDFLLYLQERIMHIFDDFVPGKILFRTFVWGLVRNTRRTWRRQRSKWFAEEESIRKTMIGGYDESREEYYQQFTDFDEAESVAIKEEWGKKEREMAEKATHILALKSCHEIDEGIIDSVSKFTHIDKNALQEQIDKMKKKSDYKSSQRELIIRRRDNAFYYHRKYLLELQKLRKGSSTFERVQKKYEQQTERWIKQNKLLTHRFVLSPSNVEIADELGMQARQVSFYINHIRKRKNTFSPPPAEKESEDTEDDDEHER